MLYKFKILSTSILSLQHNSMNCNIYFFADIIVLASIV